MSDDQTELRIYQSRVELWDKDVLLFFRTLDTAWFDAERPFFGLDGAAIFPKIVDYRTVPA